LHNIKERKRMTQLTQEQILAQANAIAEIDDDMNEAQIGGGFQERRLPPGWSVARFTSYTETGKHIELYQGKAKDPALQFRLGFELFSPNYLNEDGTPYFIETYDISRSRNEKARAFKLFKAMNYKGLAKVFPQLLNGVFLVEIKDHISKNAKPGTEPRSIIGEIRAGIDVVSGQEYQCGPATKLFLFSWAAPSLEAWDAMFIEGTNDQGKSKNWKQEKIAGATDFAGSPLEALLLTNGRPIPQGTPQKTGAAPAGAAPAPAGAIPPAPAPVAPAAPTAAPAAASAPAPAVPQQAVAPVVPSAPVVAATPVAPVAVAPVVPAAPVPPAAPAVSVGNA
jgi:hypothetical protein